MVAATSVARETLIDPGTARAQTAPVMRRTGEIRGPWIRSQGISVTRHAAALRPFRAGEFGQGAAAPSEGHLQAVNELLDQLRQELLKVSDQVRADASRAGAQPTTARLQALVTTKQRAHDWVRAIERIWDFYFELFGQRQSVFADWLLSCDRIALSCYQAAYLGVGKPKPLPAPPPFCYMRTGFSPATFRRGIRCGAWGASSIPSRWSSCPTTGWSTRGPWARCCMRSATTCKATSG